MPFLADFLWGRLVAGPCEEAPCSIFLASWPEPYARAHDATLLREMQEVRRVVELGRQARASVRAKLRQPLRQLVVEGAPLAERHADEIADELRVKEVTFARVPSLQTRLKPNLPALGPKLGARLGEVRRALDEERFEELDHDTFRVEGQS